VIGKSAPADPKNFDRELGREFAKENAIRQLWELEAYLLREKLANAEP
jgi:N4 Gp49/Sf6 Gp66 family protein